MKKYLNTYSLILIFLVGLSVLLYPTISDHINRKNQSEAVATYDEKVSQMTKQDYTKYFKAAEAYNKKLAEDPEAFYKPEKIKGYEDILDISGTGIMGYVTIDKINVKLPIYHGTANTVLEIASGHLQGTSLPVGGESTHCVISAHRGLPSSKLFTDLDKMEKGDTFTITVLNRVLTYEVDKISIVSPAEVEGLQIQNGKDFCTLMTCTPYGINTDRLLVRGHRVANREESETVHVTADATQIDTRIVAACIAIPIMIILLIAVLAGSRRKR